MLKQLFSDKPSLHAYAEVLLDVMDAYGELCILKQKSPKKLLGPFMEVNDVKEFIQIMQGEL